MQTDFKRIKMDWSPNNQKRYTWIYNKLKAAIPDFNCDIKDYIFKMNTDDANKDRHDSMSEDLNGSPPSPALSGNLPSAAPSPGNSGRGLRPRSHGRDSREA